MNPERFTVEWTLRSGLMRRAHLVPNETSARILARELCIAWVEVSDGNSGAAGQLRVAIPMFCDVMSDQVGFLPDKDGIAAIRIRHLDAWESWLLQKQAEQQSDNAYRHAVYMSALLRWIEDATPGSLHPLVAKRITEKTRLSHMPGDAMSDFSDAEVEAFKQAADAVRLRHSGDLDRACPDVLIALHIELSIETGEPPEVLRGITMDDITASTTNPHGADMSMAELAAAGLVSSYTVVLHKGRSRAQEEVMYSIPRERAVVRVLNEVISRTAPVREAQGFLSLWVTQLSRATALMDWTAHSLHEWIGRHMRPEISQPHDYRRFRKSAIAAEVISNTPIFLTAQRRHTPRTFFQRYTNSPDMRRHVGRLWVDTADDLLRRAIGPTVVTQSQAFRLDVESQSISILDDERVPSATQGALAGCHDPNRSPYADDGETCPVSRTGKCFTCPNAVIRRDHLPALVLLHGISNPDAAVSPDTWTALWKDIYEATTTVIGLFPPAQVAEARAHAAEVLVDDGLRHGIRGHESE